MIRTKNFLTLFRIMEYSIELHVHTIKSGWVGVYSEGSQDNLKNCISFSEDPYLMSHYAKFHRDRHCLPKYPLWGFQS